ncbi:MAG: hypothetical protein ACR2P0_13285 [Acidimicrobiales bacterium]
MRSLRTRRPRIASNVSRLGSLPELQSLDAWVLPRALERARTTGERSDVTRAWNSLTTFGSGVIARVDQGGAVFPVDDALAIDFLIGAGDRWVHPAGEASVRQQRVVGLPVVETRMRIGDSDVVWTAWADESEPGGRVVVEFVNEVDVVVALAVVVRPVGLLRSWPIVDADVDGRALRIDGAPRVVLPREPGDVVVGDVSTGDIVERLGRPESGPSAVRSANGTATIAAVLPLTPGSPLRVEIIGPASRNPEPRPKPTLDQVVAGWDTHLENAVALELPGWPKHLPVSLVAGLLTAGVDGSTMRDSSMLELASMATAAAMAGLPDTATDVLAVLLGRSESSPTDETELAAIATACVACVRIESAHRSLRDHTRIVVQSIGSVLVSGALSHARGDLLQLVAMVAGERAAADALAIVGSSPSIVMLEALARSGAELEYAEWSELAEELAQRPRPIDPGDIGLAMRVGARIDTSFDAVVPVRALAGNSWRWPSAVHDGEPIGDGDSPYARAALLLGLLSTIARSTADAIEVIPKPDPSWFGQNVDIRHLPTRFGDLSFSIRWHGARPALLWEFDGSSDRPLTLRSGLDATFETLERSGEALLAAPVTHSS